MSSSQEFFSKLWRVNAVLILVAAGAITFGVAALLVGEFRARNAQTRDAEAGIPVAAAADSKAPLTLGNTSLVPGTNVIRAELLLDRGGKGFSSGGYIEPRNMLFIEPSGKAGRWLLPDNDHTLTEISDVSDGSGGASDSVKRVIATVVLVKSTTDSPETTAGRLLLFDPSGRTIVEVANGVRRLQLASLSGGDLNILFERNRRLVLAAFDPVSLAKRREQEIDLTGHVAQAAQ